ncbi:MAG: viperin family antiviral radical SAM protein [Phycisphaerales bacterium]
MIQTLETVQGALPPAVNLHFFKPCNFRCTFCYAHFDDDPALRRTRTGLGGGDWRKILDALARAGATKINFAGGEPTLSPELPGLLRHTKGLGLTSSIVTNGTKLRHVLEQAPACLDWAGLSVDSAVEEVQQRLGRGGGDHVVRSIEHFDLLRQHGVRCKLNTVVTSLNWQEDMSEFARRVRPERWKLFQVLAIEGQNDGRIEPLLITPDEFRAFVERHRIVERHGIDVVPEDNDAMTESYAMIDPIGRFFSNRSGRYEYSRPILDAGVEAAFADVAFDSDKFVDRGGRFAWSTPATLTVQQT